jgi:hypothetical protein
MPRGNPNPSVATRFKKGQSGNPRGSSKAERGNSLTAILRELGEIEDVTHKGEAMARKIALGHKVWELALKGRENVIRYLYDRLDGKARESIQHMGEIDSKITIEVVSADDQSD